MLCQSPLSDACQMEASAKNVSANTKGTHAQSVTLESGIASSGGADSHFDWCSHAPKTFAADYTFVQFSQWQMAETITCKVKFHHAYIT